MPPKTPSPLMRFGVVPLAVAIALLARFPLALVLGGDIPLVLLWPAVVFCAWYGGLWPGLLATCVAALSGGIVFWIDRDLSHILGPAVWVALLAGLGGLASLALERMHEARREVEAEARKLTAERDWLRAILTGMADAVIVTNEEELVTYLNPVASAMTGWGKDAAIGQHVNQVFHITSKKTRQTIEKPVARVLRDGKAVGPDAPTVLVARDGVERRIEEWIAPIRSLDSRIIGAVLTFRDVSHLRAATHDSQPGTIKYFEPSALSQVPMDAQPGTVSLRVLVVEDNRDSAEGLAALLRLLGHEVVIAFSGPEAVKQAGEWHPQLVLCDIGLPGMDGIGVAGALRKNPATARARLIAISGNSSDEDRRRCLQSGFDHHLTKPVDPQVLQTVIALQTLVGNNENLTGRGQNSA
jgi:PAS domain S-box-containing protein